MDKNIVISISRKYGCGGRELAQILAEKLNIKLYDRKIVHIAAAKLETDDLNETLKTKILTGLHLKQNEDKQNNSKLVILDILTDVLRSLPLDEQEQFMMWEKQMKKEGVVFLNLLHTRKPSNEKGEDGFKRVSEYDILGSGTIPQSADINIVLNRNKMAEDSVERNTTYVDIPKCRGGLTGSDICKLYYDPMTRKQYDLDDWLAQQKTNF